MRLVRELRPGWCCFENVPGIRTIGADRVIEDLESEGYAVWPLVVGADDCGAPHRRKRVFFVGHANEPRESPLAPSGGPRRPVGESGDVAHAADRGLQSDPATAPQEGRPSNSGRDTGELSGRPRGPRSDVAHRDGGGRELIGFPEPGGLERTPGDEPDRRDMPLADATCRGLGERRRPQDTRNGGDTHGVSPMEHAALAGLERVREGLSRSTGLDNSDVPRPGVTGEADARQGIDGCRESNRRAAWPASPGAEQHGWEPPRCITRVESGLGDVPDGLSWRLAPFARRHALRALGNAVVPQVAEVIARAISDAMSLTAGMEPPRYSEPRQPVPAQTELFG